jgi:hypothetical protein
MQSLHLADVVDAAHVGMRHLARDAHLVMKAGQVVWVHDQILRQELESDRLTELEIVGSIYFAHAATPEEGDDAVATGEHRAGYEPHLVD